MKISSALTLTTLVSLLSTSHALPFSIKSNTLDIGSKHSQLRRDSAISNIVESGSMEANDQILAGLGTAFEPGNNIKQLFNMVKRQLGSTDSTSDSTSTTADTSSQDATAAQGYTTSSDTTHGVTPLMGGSLTSASAAGFGFEPGNIIPNVKV